MFRDCPRVLWAVDFSEINVYRLKASLMAFSHLDSKRRFTTARVERRSVDFSEINVYRLKAGMLAFGHESSKWGSMTARVVQTAVDFRESTFC